MGRIGGSFTLQETSYTDEQLYTIMCEAEENGAYVALIRGNLCRTLEDFYKEIGRHRKLVLILALNCYQHCLEHYSFENASYFEAYVEKIIGKSIKLYERNVFHYLKGFARYQKGQTEEGRQQMQEAMHIFDVLGLPGQVAYYQEHFDKFVKNECSK